MVKDFEINSIDLSTGEKSIKSFKFSPLSENLSSIAFQIYTNQKKNRFVYSFTKSRSDFRSGGAKPYRQKGTGRSRMGTTRSPLKVGGSVIFGPKPRKVLRKTNANFFKSSINQLLKSKLHASTVYTSIDKINVLKDIKKYINPNKTYLFIMNVNFQDDINFFLTIKNLPNIYFNNVNSIVVEDLLRVDNLIYSTSSFDYYFNEDQIGSSK